VCEKEELPCFLYLIQIFARNQLLKLGHHVVSTFPALCKPCHEDLQVLEMQIWRRDVNSRELVLRKNLASTALRPLIHKFLLLGYFLGLLTATVSSEFFKAAQPALLYLVPFTLFPLFLMAYLKGDLRSMWEVDFANNNYTKLPKCQVIWKKNPFHNSYRQIKQKIFFNGGTVIEISEI